jgi:hypothetical protein
LLRGRGAWLRDRRTAKQSHKLASPHASPQRSGGDSTGPNALCGRVEVSFLTDIVDRSMSQLGQIHRFDPSPATSGLVRSTDIIRPARLVRFVPKPEISPKAKPLDARRAFFRAAQKIRSITWQGLRDLASVLGEQQRHQLIDRCRQVAGGRGATLLPLARRAGGQS